MAVAEPWFPTLDASYRWNVLGGRKAPVGRTAVNGRTGGVPTRRRKLGLRPERTFVARDWTPQAGLRSFSASRLRRARLGPRRRARARAAAHRPSAALRRSSRHGTRPSPPAGTSSASSPPQAGTASPRAMSTMPPECVVRQASGHASSVWSVNIVALCCGLVRNTSVTCFRNGASEN
jgi:hypothetical protein